MPGYIYKTMDSTMNPPITVLEALKIGREVPGESTARTKGEQTHLPPKPPHDFSVTAFTDIQNTTVNSC